MTLLIIAFRNISRNKKRSILSISSTCVATFGIVFLFSFVGGLNNDMKNISFSYESGEILVRNIEFTDKSFSLNRAVDNYKDVLSIIKKELPNGKLSPRIRFPSTIFTDGKRIHCLGIAVDFNTELGFLQLGNSILEGTIPVLPTEVLIGTGFAKELGLGIGDKFTPITKTRKGASSGITFIISGIVKFSNPYFTNKAFLTSLEKVPFMLKMDGAVSEILIKDIGEKYINPTVLNLNSLFENSKLDSIQAYSWKDIGSTYAFLEAKNIMYSVIGFVFFALASTVIANTMLMIVFERKREIGTIISLGMSSSEVIRLFFLEGMFLGLLGAGLGVLLGLICVLPFSYIGMDLTYLAGSGDSTSSWFIYPVLSLKSTMGVFVYSVLISSMVSFIPSKSVASVDPVVALRA